MKTPPGLVGSCLTTRREKIEHILSRKHRPLVLWSVVLNAAVILPVGVSDPCCCGRRSFSSLYFFMPGGNTDGTKEEGGKLTEPTTSTCRCDRAISSLSLTSTSFGKRSEGHPARSCPHPCLCRRRGRGWIRSSSSHPRSCLHRLYQTPS